MMDDTKLGRAINRGQQAQTILDNELFEEAFTALETHYKDAWAATKMTRTEERENLYRAVSVLGQVKAHFRSVLQNGQLAKKQLDDLARSGTKTFSIF